MEKISGILKTSPRVASVDLKEAAPVRPGTPTFGRPVGVSSLKADPTAFFDTSKRGAEVQEQMSDWRSKDARQAAMAREVSERFFVNNRRAAEPVVDIDEPSTLPALHSASSRLAGFKTDELGSLQAASPAALGSSSRSLDSTVEQESLPAPLQQPEGLFPKGSFLNRTV